MRYGLTSPPPSTAAALTITAGYNKFSFQHFTPDDSCSIV